MNTRCQLAFQFRCNASPKTYTFGVPIGSEGFYFHQGITAIGDNVRFYRVTGHLGHLQAKERHSAVLKPPRAQISPTLELRHEANELDGLPEDIDAGVGRPEALITDVSAMPVHVAVHLQSRNWMI